MLKSHTFTGSCTGRSEAAISSGCVFLFVYVEPLELMQQQANSENRIDDIVFHFNEVKDEEHREAPTPLRRQVSASAATVGRAADRAPPLSRSMSGSETTITAPFHDTLHLGVFYPHSTSNEHVLVFKISLSDGSVPLEIFQQRGKITCSLILGEETDLETEKLTTKLSFEVNFSATRSNLLLATVSEGKCNSSKFYEGMVVAVNANFNSSASGEHIDFLAQCQTNILNFVKDSYPYQIFRNSIKFGSALEAISDVSARGVFMDPLHALVLIGDLFQLRDEKVVDVHAEYDFLSIEKLFLISRLAEKFVWRDISKAGGSAIKEVLSAHPMMISALKFLMHMDVERPSGPTYAAGQ